VADIRHLVRLLESQLFRLGFV
jgi:hypothetical protein